MQPWRVWEANVLDAVVQTILSVYLIAGAVVSGVEPNITGIRLMYCKANDLDCGNLSWQAD